MAKLKSWDDLKRFREESQTETSLLKPESEKTILAVGEATCGIAAGAKKVADALRDEINRQGIQNVSVVTTGCLGYCYAEPMVEVRMPGKESVYYGYVTEKAARKIVSGHLVQGEPVIENIFHVEVNTP